MATALVHIPAEFSLTQRSKRRDFRLIQGADFFLALSFDSSVGSDWSGFACRAQLRRDVADRAGEILASFTATIVSPGPLARVVQFHLSNAVTAGLKVDQGRWDAEIYNGIVVYRIVQGTWALNRGVTA